MRSVVSNVVVETEGDGLDVRWEVDGDDLGVDIGVGPSPEAVDHVHALTVATGRRKAHIGHRAGGRPFVSIAPAGEGGAMVVADRRVPFEGVTNFRDLGGYATGDGRRTRWNRVFRSDALHRLTEQDMGRYHSLGLHAVYDLRGRLHPRPAGPAPHGLMAPSAPRTRMAPRTLMASSASRTGTPRRSRPARR